jgi:tetratricopeptide (TPR) repeat protein
MNASMDDMREKACSRLKEGYFEDAVELFSGCLLLNPDEAKTHYGRGMAHFQLKEWESAIADFEKATELDAKDPENHLAFAMSLAMDNRIYEAIDCYEALLAEKPQFVRAHIRLAMLYYQIGLILKGHRQLEIALASRPSLSERKTIEALKKEQLVLDKKRFYKPDFENLRQHDRASSAGFWGRIKHLLSGAKS